jgi:bifunctional DNA-binding transcriptional regulator/antitoxin component of YhaV-PrlF toxin-antitoxin module
MVKLQEVTGRYFICIPKEYVKLKKWKKGQELAIGFDHEGNLVIKQVK